MRNMLSVHRDNEDLISIGAYKSGNNPELDEAISHMEKINSFLKQEVDEPVRYSQTLRLLEQAVK